MLFQQADTKYFKFIYFSHTNH